MRNPWAKEIEVCRETERDHGGEMNRGGGALLGATLGLIGWTLILMFVL